MDTEKQDFICRYVFKMEDEEWEGGEEILLSSLKNQIDRKYPHGKDVFIIGCQVTDSITLELAKRIDGKWATINKDCAILPWTLNNRKELAKLRELLLECSMVDRSTGIIERLSKIEKMANELYFRDSFGSYGESFFQKLHELACGNNATILSKAARNPPPLGGG